MLLGAAVHMCLWSQYSWEIMVHSKLIDWWVGGWTLSPSSRYQVYGNHAFIVSEASGHGMQIYDFTQLNWLKPPRSGFNILYPTAHNGEFGNAHNIVSNEEEGYVYAGRICAGCSCAYVFVISVFLRDYGSFKINRLMSWWLNSLSLLSVSGVWQSCLHSQWG